jgi:hypothetical protein
LLPPGPRHLPLVIAVVLLWWWCRARVRPPQHVPHRRRLDSPAILIGPMVLLVAGGVAMATLPSLVAPRQSVAVTPAGNATREVIDLNERSRSEAPEPA